MKVGMRYWRSSIVLIVAVVVLMGSTTAFARNPNPGVLPPNSHPRGLTYGEWSARWWQYAFSVTTLDNCPAEPSGPLWFLAGTTDGTIATRNCTVPAGRAILFPIINAEWSVVEAQANGDACLVPAIPSGTSDEALRACAIAQINHVTKLEADVDGVPLQDLTIYRALSPAFDFTAAPGNLFGVCSQSGCTTHAVADGFWIMLTPLSAGSHTVHFRGEAFFPELNNFTFVTGATYNLTVG